MTIKSNILSVQNIFKAVFIFSLILFSVHSGVWAQDIPIYPDGDVWDFVREKAGVQAYTRKVEGRVLKDFRMQCMIDVPFDSINKFMKNPDNYPSWCAIFPNFRVAGFAEDGGFYTAFTIPTPFFTKSRDAIFRNDIRDISNGLIIRLKAAPEYLPEDPRYIRVQTALALLIFQKKGENAVECQYRGSVDPAGDLPDRFANLTAYNLPLENIILLKNVLENKYKK